MSDREGLALIVRLRVVTFAIKAAGPIALGGRELPDWFARVVTLLAPALLSALVVTQVFAERPGARGRGRHGRRRRRRRRPVAGRADRGGGRLAAAVTALLRAVA
jgi:hypothetical protein